VACRGRSILVVEAKLGDEQLEGFPEEEEEEEEDGDKKKEEEQKEKKEEQEDRCMLMRFEKEEEFKEQVLGYFKLLEMLN
jgi:hypothetical protein